MAQLVAEIDNLNSLINGIEKEMLKLKQRYEVAVEERNYTGIQVLLTTHYSLLTTHYSLLTTYGGGAQLHRHPGGALPLPLPLTLPLHLPLASSSTATTSCVSSTRSATCSRPCSRG